MSIALCCGTSVELNRIKKKERDRSFKVTMEISGAHVGESSSKVGQNNKACFIDETGKIAIPAVGESAGPGWFAHSLNLVDERLIDERC
jgi:hypothetical protein